jgi:hypothetical protein
MKAPQDNEKAERLIIIDIGDIPMPRTRPLSPIEAGGHRERIEVPALPLPSKR